MTLGSWIREREHLGCPCFSLEDVRVAFPHLSASGLSSALSRYRAKGVIQSVHKGFFVVIPPHCILQGRVPDTYYIDQLMNYLKRPYYLSLLSAASFWGASHQAVMVTHVMTQLPYTSASREKNNSLRWFYRNVIPERLLVTKNSETGTVKYSNAELTAIDLVHWASRIGGLSAIATVLAELRESTHFIGAASGAFLTADTSDVQRLGYLYDVILGDREQADIIYDELRHMSTTLRNVRLIPENQTHPLRRDKRWHIDVTDEIEVDDL